MIQTLEAQRQQIQRDSARGESLLQAVEAQRQANSPSATLNSAHARSGDPAPGRIRSDNLNRNPSGRFIPNVQSERSQLLLSDVSLPSIPESWRENRMSDEYYSSRLTNRPAPSAVPTGPSTSRPRAFNPLRGGSLREDLRSRQEGESSSSSQAFFNLIFVLSCKTSVVQKLKN